MNIPFNSASQRPGAPFRFSLRSASPLTRIGVTLVFALAYYLFARFGFSFAAIEPQVSAIWPPAGLALAAAFLLGYDIWPGILLGAFFANLVVSRMFFPSLAIGAGNTVETLLALYLIKKFVPDGKIFDRTKSTVEFTLLAGFVSTAAGGLLGTLTLFAAGAVPVALLPAVWFTWWMGDAAGLLLLATPLIMWASVRGLQPRRISYFLGVLVLMIVTEKVAFGGWLQFLPSSFPIAFITLPPLIVGAFWLGRRWAMTTVLFFAVLATRDTVLGMGSFASYPATQSLLLLQTFLGTVAATTLIVSVLIAERRDAMRAVSYREQYFRSLIEKSSEGIVVVSAEGKVLYASPSLERVTGYDASENRLTGASSFNNIHPDDLFALKSRFAKLLRHPEEAIPFEVRFRHRNGHWIWLSAIASNLLDYPYVEGIVVNMRDVTREKESQQAQSYLASIVESADDAIIGRDLDGIIHSWNEGAQRLYGYSAEEAIGKPISMIVPAERRRIELEELTAHIRHGETVSHYETVRVRKDGVLIPVSFSVSPMRGAGGVIIGASIIARDLTKEKELERRKHQFISSISYQLRNPVGEIGTYIDSLRKRKGKFTPLEQQYLLKIENANLRMAMLLNNLLKLTRVELGTIPVEPRPTELKREIDYVVREFTEKLGAKEIVIECPYRKIGRAVVTVDPALFTAVLVSLLSHAAAYVPPRGKVSIDVVRAEKDIRIHIRESGESVATQISQALTPGTGALAEDADPSMDLYVAQSLVERIGGTLNLERSASGATRFSIVFPTA